MKINNIFEKKIDRNIQGVIKVGQDSNETIKDELEEYVVTKELDRHFDKFFEIYKNGTQKRTDKIGVWISGFFGSGKSHFLKILSYILSNDMYNDSKAIKYFEDKILDETVFENMKIASDTSADVILFNIDAKAESDSKSNKDAIVKVFMKVFNEMQGYCGSMPWIADLERKLDRNETYKNFKIKFKQLSGMDWEESRDDFYFEEDNIIKALSCTTKMNEEVARNWYNKSEANYSLDVTQFAKKVKDYIDRKSEELGKKHFVIFLCDEIGQYIGSDDNLMLNLQTVVENLGTECGGRAWLIATSQQDIDSITKVNSDNFSKIIGRFDTRLSLSSANVDEVIKKRLLIKTELAEQELKILYSKKSTIIKNLISFSEETPEKKLYKNEQEFLDVYPFIPYQFNLLQEVFTGIRTHGASGKHLSEGERSLLNAFQEAVLQFSSFETGMLIPFDAFYKTIETFLDHNIKTVFIHAEQNQNLVPADIEVLKVLFMIKYISNTLSPNIENIATLMIQAIDEDKIAKQKSVDASLRRLEREKLIIKNGGEYVFLTNDEQEINREISETKIDISEIIDKTGDEIVSILFGLNKKYTYKDGYDFSFNIIIDDKVRGTQKEEIGVKILTPYYIRKTEQDMMLLSSRENNVIVSLSDDTTPFDEMKKALQIDVFIRKNLDKKGTDIIENIKNTKIREAKQRRERCKSSLIDILKKAELYANSTKLDIRRKTPSDRIFESIKTLIEITYTKLDYITKPYLNIENLRKILKDSSDQIMLECVLEDSNRLALEDLTYMITRQSGQNVQTSIKTIIDIFKKIPYGWSDIDIAGLILTLFKKQDIRLELNGQIFSATNILLVDDIIKHDKQDKILVKIRLKVQPNLLINARNLMKQVFGLIDIPNDEDGLMSKFIELTNIELTQKSDSIKDLLAEYSKGKYPGKETVRIGQKIFEDVIKIKDVASFFAYLNTEKETLLDYGEDILDIRMFFKNQRVIFDKALKILDIYNSNRNYVSDEQIKNIAKEIERIIKLDCPYSEIQKLPSLADDFANRFGTLLEVECEPIRKEIEADKNIVRNEMINRNLEDFFGDRVQEDFSTIFDRLETVNKINDAFALRQESDRIKVKFFDEFAIEEERRKPKEDENIELVEKTASVKRIKNISVKTLFSGTNQISNAEDIDKLLENIKLKLVKQLEDNTTINII